MAMGATVSRMRIELIFRQCWISITSCGQHSTAGEERGRSYAGAIERTSSVREYLSSFVHMQLVPTAPNKQQPRATASRLPQALAHASPETSTALVLACFYHKYSKKRLKYALRHPNQ
jgi:hypothetical protein